jgi:hypothetical protein
VTSRLENLVGTDGSLKREPPDSAEFQGLRSAGLARLKDATRSDLSLDSRLDLAYNAAHSLCLAALRYRGFRPAKRYIVFQVLPETLGLGPEVWRVLDKCHGVRNRSEYEGVSELDEDLVIALIKACQAVAAAARKLPTPG